MQVSFSLHVGRLLSRGFACTAIKQNKLFTYCTCMSAKLETVKCFAVIYA